MRLIDSSISYEKHLFGLEDQFEREILRMKHEIFRSGHYDRWDPLLTDELSDSGVKPDGIFIPNELDDWWIIEVELGRKEKMTHIVDQLGRLERVNYSNYRELLEKQLSKMGIENPDTLARNLCSEKPKFMLIIDDYNQEIIDRAEQRGFTTMVIETFRSPCGQLKLFLENENALSREINPHSDPIYVIKPPPNKLKVQRDIWWHELTMSHPFSNSQEIQMVDSKGTFSVLIEDFADKKHLRLPRERESIHGIFVGNRWGNIFATEFDDHYEIKLVWPPI